MKIVINRCYGGFVLSDAAYEKLIEWGIPVRRYEENPPEGIVSEKEVIYDDNLTDVPDHKAGRSGRRYWEVWLSSSHSRSHPLLVRVVEELGEKAHGECAKLKVVDVPDEVDWDIDDYDGMESVHERHSSWD